MVRIEQRIRNDFEATWSENGWLSYENRTLYQNSYNKGNIVHDRILQQVPWWYAIKKVQTELNQKCLLQIQVQTNKPWNQVIKKNRIRVRLRVPRPWCKQLTIRNTTINTLVKKATAPGVVCVGSYIKYLCS